MYDRRLMMLLATLGATAGVATYAATADAVVVGNDTFSLPRERYGTRATADMAGARCAPTASNLRSSRAQSPLPYRASRPSRRPQ